MTILAVLVRRYDRMAEKGEVPPFGYSTEKIGWCIALDADGSVSSVYPLYEDPEARKPRPKLMTAPRPAKRTSGVASNFLWDKTSYVLGVTAGEGRRTAQEHEAFKSLHRDAIAETDDPGLKALLAFLDRWSPEDFVAPSFPDEMRDGNVVFRLASERGYLHDRKAARDLWTRRLADNDAKEAVCLVTGERGPLARLHPAIKGVWGAQSSGASVVSFNLDAFESYDHRQGENAPVSERAAFAYTTALNALLAQGSANRLQIGDASTVFWAEADGENADAREAAAEDLFAAVSGAPIDTAKQEAAIRPIADAIAKGRANPELSPELARGVRFSVLGLSPNAARLSVRYWFQGDFGELAQNLYRHCADLHIEPTPHAWKQPGVNLLLARTTALQGKFDNIPELLAGAVARAVVTGTHYPQILLSAVLTRLRAGDDAGTGWHAAVIKACLNRALRIRLGEPDASHPRRELELPVALQEDLNNTPYQLGRLFAVMEAAQRVALGRVNAPIGDRYFAAASATPARVFPTLMRGMKTHVADARKRNTGFWIEPRVESILAKLPPDLPKALRLEDQGRFAVGYYHERASRTAKTPDQETTANDRGTEE